MFTNLLATWFAFRNSLGSRLVVNAISGKGIFTTTYGNKYFIFPKGNGAVYVPANRVSDAIARKMELDKEPTRVHNLLTAFVHYCLGAELPIPRLPKCIDLVRNGDNAESFLVKVTDADWICYLITPHGVIVGHASSDYAAQMVAKFKYAEIKELPVYARAAAIAIDTIGSWQEALPIR